MSALWATFPRWRRAGTPEPAGLRQWIGQALCALSGGDWFSVDSGTIAKAICRECPVQEACLIYALDAGEAFGIWGGLDPDQRRSLIDRLRALEAELASAHRQLQAA